MYVIKNWKEFQHYSNRNPPWVKLHKKLLDDYEFHHLPVASRALAPMLWLLASEHENPQSGFINGPAERISFRLHLSPNEFLLAIKPLIDKGFVEEASEPLAERQQVATPETETENRGQRKRHTFNGGRNEKRSFSQTGYDLAEQYRTEGKGLDAK